jgi:Tfp pilus assembly protein PilO
MATLQYKNSLSRYRKYLQTVQNQPLLKASLFLILSIVLVIILIATALQPTLTTIADLIGQISKQKTLEQKMDAKISALQEAQKQLAAISSKIVYLDEAIPTSSTLSVWSQSLSRVASESGVTITNINLANVPTAKAESSISLPFQITGNGQYGQLYRFLQSLQSLRRLIKLDKVDILRSGTDSNVINIIIVGSISESP